MVSGRQCGLLWPDPGAGGPLYKRIVIEPSAGLPVPAYHVHQHWCQGSKYVPLPADNPYPWSFL
jgi:hypothetical protein